MTALYIVGGYILLSIGVSLFMGKFIAAGNGNSTRAQETPKVTGLTELNTQGS